VRQQDVGHAARVLDQELERPRGAVPQKALLVNLQVAQLRSNVAFPQLVERILHKTPGENQRHGAEGDGREGHGRPAGRRKMLRRGRVR
jgi:hypothetical protein